MLRYPALVWEAEVSLAPFLFEAHVMAGVRVLVGERHPSQPRKQAVWFPARRSEVYPVLVRAVGPALYVPRELSLPQPEFRVRIRR